MSEQLHHWHHPSQGQVTKALFQYFNDNSVLNRETVNELVESKLEKIIEKSVNSKVAELINSDRFLDFISISVINCIQNEKMSYDKSSYGFHQRIRDLVNKAIQEMVLKYYEVEVKKK